MQSKNKPYISVVIPVYNGRKSIEGCLRAILNQKIEQAYEVIVVDDGSKDETAALVKQFKNVRLIQQSNAGPAKARNQGAEHSHGEIIVFMDADCVAERHFLREMVKAFSNKEISGVQGSYKTGQKELIARITQLEIEERYEKMKKRKYIDHIGSYAAAYRKELFLGEGGFDTSFPKASGEDTEFSYRLVKKGHKLLFNPNAVVGHTHPASLWHYLKVNRVRGFYRIGVYRKHTWKIVDDSYSSKLLKLQFIFFLPTLFGLLLYFYVLFTPAYFSHLPAIGIAVVFGGFFVLLPITRFTKSNISKDALASITYLGVGILRIAALSVGIWSGVLSGGLKK